MNAIVFLLHEFGSLCTFFWRIVRTTFTTQGNHSAVIAQVASISIRSLPTVAAAGIFVGAVIVLQFNMILADYDGQIFLGGLNTSAVVREVGPLIISFLLAGKIGAFTAAELGTMRVTEQIEAIECLGTDPVQYLIVPRFLGIVYSSVIMLMMGLLISVAGSMFVAYAICNVNPLQYISTVPRFVGAWTVFGGFLQSVVYGLIVGAVACHQGFITTGGARGVGRAVTMASLYTNFYIVVANYFVTQVLASVASFVEMMWGVRL